MSKVYSFRLDDNNPREAQAKEIIETWVSQGYSLRHQFVDVLIAFHKKCQGSEYNELLEKVERLILNSKEYINDDEDAEKALTATFIESLSKSMKDGLRVE